MKIAVGVQRDPFVSEVYGSAVISQNSLSHLATSPGFVTSVKVEGCDRTRPWSPLSYHQSLCLEELRNITSNLSQNCLFL